MGEEDATHYDRMCREVARGQRFICAGQVLVVACQIARRLIGLGAEAFALGSGRGTGDIDADVPHHLLDLGPADSAMAGIRLGLSALERPSREVESRLDDFDPTRTARVVLPFFSTSTHVLRRRVFGGRPPEWAALEDKTTVDALWDAAGVPRAPAEIVEARLEPAWAAAQALDEGHGTVWVADNKQGWHGGAEYLRWVRTEVQARATAHELGPVADRFRVMPFLEGLPCSIHGLVLPDHVVTFRPLEMVVLRKPGQTRLHYAQVSSFWEPSSPVVEALRATARRVGAHLRERVGYRGAFTVDGVLTARGFRPTELNPRYGAGLTFLADGIPGLWLYLLHLCMVEGLELDWRPRALEELVLSGSRRRRAAGGMASVARAFPEPRTLRLGLRDGAWHVLSDPETPADATARLGPGPTGGVVMVRLDPERTPVGPSSAPRIAGVLMCLDEHLDLGLGPLEAAPDLAERTSPTT